MSRNRRFCVISNSIPIGCLLFYFNSLCERKPVNPSQVLRYKTKNICNLITQDSLGFGRFACTVLIDYCNYFSLGLTTPEVWPLLILDDEVMVQQISNFWLLLAMVHLSGQGCLAIQYIMLKTKIERIQL